MDNFSRVYFNGAKSLLIVRNIQTHRAKDVRINRKCPLYSVNIRGLSYFLGLLFWASLRYGRHPLFFS